MDESTRRPEYRESPEQRARLDELNALLADIEGDLESAAVTPAAPLVFIVGAPRSGTTLSSQILVSSGSYAWVNNFVARFWRAPTVGAKIANALGLYSPGFTSSFESAWGTTQGWPEPHEFGYFWNRYFDLGQDTHKLSERELARVDRAGLCRAIDRLQTEYAAPLVMKNATWCTLQAAYLAHLFPRAIFVACFRDVAYLAQSCLLARRERLEDPDGWWSVKPATYHSCAVCRFSSRLSARRATSSPGSLPNSTRSTPHVWCGSTTQICRDPAGLCRRVAAAAGIDAGNLTRIAVPFEPRDDVRITVDEWQTLYRLASTDRRGTP